MSDPQGGHGPAPVGAKASPVRLVVLLAILAILVGALGFDMFVAKPGVEAADRTLKREAEKNNSIGFEKDLSVEERQKRMANSLLDRDDVRRILSKSPATTIKGAGYEIEVYRWWGYLPLKRHYMSVVYLGSGSNLRYSTHYVNSEAPAESLPGYERPPVSLEMPEGVAAATKKGGMGSPGGGAGPPGKGGKGGKGKGGMKGKKVTPPAEAADAGIAPPGDSTDATKQGEKGTKEGDKAGEKTTKEGDQPTKDKPAGEKPSDKAEDKPEAKTDEKPPAAKEAETKKEEGDKPAAEKKTDE
jgi:hypothetical protein